jgi:hypothetical protein
MGVIISAGQQVPSSAQAHKGLQKSSIDVSRVCSRVCRDEEHRREFVLHCPANRLDIRYYQFDCDVYLICAVWKLLSMANFEGQLETLGRKAERERGEDPTNQQR